MSNSPPTTRCSVSVIILTFNEAETIETCLSHLDWADDVILVDSFSTDATVERTTTVRPDLRVFQHAFKDFGDQRNYALDETSPRHDWVLFIDADEHVNVDCAKGIQQALKHPGDNVGFYLTCRNIFLGRWVKRCTLYPSWQLRLLKRGEVRYRKEGHGQREVTDGPLGYVDEPYDHYGFSNGIEHWIARHNKYSTNEVELIHRLRTEPLAMSDLLSRDPIVRRRCLKRMAARFGFRPVARFVYLYFIRRGFLDGWPGFQFCMLRVAHEIHITTKLNEADYFATHTSPTHVSPTHASPEDGVKNEVSLSADAEETNHHEEAHSAMPRG